ncbi:MAG: HAD family hydrolase [Flavisolibacter sp.]
MQIKINQKSFFVFDLDDTIFQEIDYLKSGYLSISTKLREFIDADIFPEMMEKYQNKENVFEWIVKHHQGSIPHLSMHWLLKEYREHLPTIDLSGRNAAFLQQLRQLNVPMGLITDGRSITQRNKLKALGIEGYFTDIIISEEFGSVKPDQRNYLYFEHKYPGMHFYFLGDNTTKDFIVPKQLGWTTICIKNSGNHIHTQVFDQESAPDYIITGFDEIELIQ